MQFLALGPGKVAYPVGHFFQGAEASISIVVLWFEVTKETEDKKVEEIETRRKEKGKMMLKTGPNESLK